MGHAERLAGVSVLLVAVGVALVVHPMATGIEPLDRALLEARTTDAGRWVTGAWCRYAELLQHGYLEQVAEEVLGKSDAPAAEDCACKEAKAVIDCDSQTPLEDAFKETKRVDECCCALDVIEQLNAVEVYPALEELITKPFFRYFKVKLYTECPLWPDDGQCMMETCAVAECDEGDIPLPWRLAEKGELDMDVVCTLDKGRVEGSKSEQPVDTHIDAGVQLRLSHVYDWKGVNNPWMVEDAGDDDEFIYVDLRRNPEKNTGYKGEHARKVWGAIYGQKCFEDINSPEACQEDKVFYKLVSGVHTSITTHTMPSHLLKHRLGPEWAKPFVDNLFFSYLFTLRAVMKARPLLIKMTFDTGNTEDDLATKNLMQTLVASPTLQSACPLPFDEGRMWRGQGSEEKKEELRLQLHNVTRAMDCVGCDKCKMWAKLRMLGVAAAFKILFSVNDCVGANGSGELVLERNEVIALINLLAQFSSSIEAVRTMWEIRDPPAEPETGASPVGGGGLQL